jgi:hypothetical protein
VAGDADHLSVDLILDTLATSFMTSTLAATTGMVMEILPLTDISTPMVMMTTPIVSTSVAETRTLTRLESHLPTALVSMHTNTARPMNLGGMCYDCMLAYIVSSSIMSTTTADADGHPHGDHPDRDDDEWTRSFAEKITTDILADDETV